MADIDPAPVIDDDRTDMSLPVLSSISDARNHSGTALLPFVPAGYLGLDVTVAVLKSLTHLGIGAIEVGFPFSDPIADGPVIQEAFVEALDRGTKIEQIFQAIGAAQNDIAKPLVAMCSFSLAFRYGIDRFLADAKKSGFSAILFPDLPLPDGFAVCEKVRAAGLDTVMLVAPTTSAKRRGEIAKLCSGFVYYLSVSGITGERDKLPDDLETNVKQLRAQSSVPVCIGFGIGKRAHVEQLRGVGDGAIVGTGIVRRMREHAADQPAVIAQAVAEYCRELLGDASK
jgi:tryptophan synthase alpha chain